MAFISSRVLLFFLSLVFIIISQAKPQPSFFHFCIYDEGNYTSRTYEENLNLALSDLTISNDTNTYKGGFYPNSHGEDSDRVFAIGLCRRDINADVCRSCLNESRFALKQLCPNQKEAIGWYDNCMLRYSNRSLLCIKEDKPAMPLWNTPNVSEINGSRYSKEVKSVLDGMISEAESDKFATRILAMPDNSTIYALVQCTPDLEDKACSDCLKAISEEIPECCLGKEGGRYYTPSCNFRYETHSFFNLTADAPSPQIKGRIILQYLISLKVHVYS